MTSISGFGGFQPNFSQMQSKMFSKSDADGSGGISLDEMKSAQQNMPMGKSGVSDADMEAKFNEIDTDGDGQVNETEHKAFTQKMSDQMQSMLISMQGSGGFGGMGGGGMDITELFKSSDADGNGSVSKSEMKSSSGIDNDEQLDALFSMIDGDGDGEISQTESEEFSSTMNNQFASGETSESDMTQKLLDAIAKAADEAYSKSQSKGFDISTLFGNNLDKAA